jgi:Predicted soluble lytic transglycosylase fused to an ABC-type amino acid-binding protein
LAFAWAFPETVDSRLLEAANTFLTDNEDTIAGLIEAHIDQQPASIADVKTFTQQLKARLPAFESLFREAALLTGWDWRLLVAVAYQESHLDPNARSPTGVRGIMMLTLNTMRELGYESRLDPKQSIEGGARYLAQLKERLPNRIKDPDRTWFTLAAYNMGMGHLEDARVLTERQGGNPDRWQDVAARLPLLQDPTFYRTLKFGFGRGKQAAKYVANIQQYYDSICVGSTLRTNQNTR